MRHFIVLAVVAFLGCAFVQGRAIRDVKSDLITKGNDLLKKADEAIKKLTAEHKTHEVEVVKKEEADIQKLLKELQAAKEPKDLTHIEHDLRIAENRLAFELRRIEHPPHDIYKEILLSRAKALEKQATETINKLKSQKRDTEAAILEKEEALIKKLVSELEHATASADVRHLEHDLSTAELKLSYELRKINGPELIKDILIKRATSLEKQADELIKKLKADKKDAEAAEIEKDEALVKKLVSELQSVKPGDSKNLVHIEQQLSGAESRLSIAMRKASGHGAHDFVKEGLLKRATTLEKQAEEAIKSLKAAGKQDAEIAVIEKEEAEIKKLAKELQTATNLTDVQKLEKQLSAAEAKLNAELKKVHPVHHLVRRDVKTDLIKKGNDLLKQADEAIKKHKPQEMTKLVSEEAEIKKLLIELEAAKDASKITHIEHDLRIAESRLAYELRKIEHPVHPHPDHKEVLLNRAKTLEKQAETIVKKLKADGHKEADVALIEKEEALVKKLVKDLEAAKTPAEVSHIEHELQSAEYKLSYQLRKISDQDFKEELKKKALLRRATYLEQYAKSAILKLKEIKKDSEIATVEKEEALVAKLVKDLNAAKTNDEIHKIEKQLIEAEDNLYAELRKINAWVHDSKLKTELLAKAAVLEKQATEAIKSLKAAKKDAEVAVIEKEEKIIKDLVTKLNAAKTDADIHKIELELSSAEATLTAELQKVKPHHLVRRDVKEDLLKQSGTLINTAREAVDKLRSQGKHDLASGIENIEKFLIDIESQVRNFHPHTLLGREAQKILEQLLHQGETRLEEALKKLNN